MPFQFFLPAFICPDHADKNAKWAKTLEENIKKIYDQYARLPHLKTAKGISPPLFVLPKMINSMIVEMKKSGKSEAIAFFEAIVSFWRTTYWYFNKDKKILEKGIADLKGFIEDRDKRLKQYFPDAGVIFGMFMCLTDKVDSTKFLDAYWEES